MRQLRGLRVPEQFFQITLLQDLTPVHEQGGIGDFSGLLGIVAYQQYGQTPFTA